MPSKAGHGWLQQSQTNDQQTAVHTGRAHLGVFSLRVLPADLITSAIATYPQMLLMPEHHRLAQRQSLRLTDLAGTELIVPPHARPHWINLESGLTDADVT